MTFAPRATRQWRLFQTGAPQCLQLWFVPVSSRRISPSGWDLFTLEHKNGFYIRHENRHHTSDLPFQHGWFTPLDLVALMAMDAYDYIYHSCMLKTHLLSSLVSWNVEVLLAKEALPHSCGSEHYWVLCHQIQTRSRLLWCCNTWRKVWPKCTSSDIAPTSVSLVIVIATATATATTAIVTAGIGSGHSLRLGPARSPRILAAFGPSLSLPRYETWQPDLLLLQ